MWVSSYRSLAKTTQLPRFKKWPHPLDFWKNAKVTLYIIQKKYDVRQNISLGLKTHLTDFTFFPPFISNE